MPAIAVRERVDLSDNLMMKPDGNFVDGKGLMFDPEPYVSQKPADPLLDFGEGAAKIDSVACTILSSPFPRRIEHSAVKFTDIYSIERVSLTHHSRTKGPSLGLQNILPLPLVEFSSCCEVGNKLSCVVRMERRITRSSIEIGNCTHRFLSRRCASSSISFETLPVAWSSSAMVCSTSRTSRAASWRVRRSANSTMEPVLGTSAYTRLQSSAAANPAERF